MNKKIIGIFLSLPLLLGLNSCSESKEIGRAHV